MDRKVRRVKVSDPRTPGKVASDKEGSRELDELRQAYMDSMRTYRTPSEGLKQWGH